jgi:phasin family protein
MTSLSDHLSTVRQSQWEAQLDVFRTLTNRALDSANQLIALNLRTSRASVEQATGTIQQMLHATDPRDLVAIGSQAQGQWQQLFSYSRELLGIAAGVRQAALAGIPAPQLAAPQLATPVPPVQLVPAANVPTPVPHVLEQVAIATADATTVTSEIAAAAAETGTALAEATLDAGQSLAKTAKPEATIPEPAPAEPQAVQAVEETQANETQANVEALADTVLAEEVPAAKAKPIAKALSEVARKPASADHPIASTVPLEAQGHVALPTVTPSESTPPVHLSAGPARDAKSARASRKK